MSRESIKPKKTIDYLLLVVVIAITLFGAYMILSATYYKDIFDESNNPLLTFNSSYKKILLGFGVMLVAIFFDIRWIKKMSPFLMLISLGLLLSTLFIGRTINGSSRWLMIGSMSFAPSELIKVASILYFAKILEHMHKSSEHYLRAWVSVMLFGGGAIIIINFQPDLSTAMVYSAILGIMLLVAGAKWQHIGLIILIGAMLVSVAIMSKPYRVERFLDFWSDDYVLTGDAAQSNQSLMAIAEGGITGVGPGQAYQTKSGHAQSESDFIFATVAETTGFIGAILLISAYTFMLWRLTRIAILSQSRYAALVTSGILGMIGIQAAIHLMVTTKIMPVTGVPLPLVSSGGTSTIIILGSIGIALNLSSNPENI